MPVGLSLPSLFRSSSRSTQPSRFARSVGTTSRGECWHPALVARVVHLYDSGYQWEAIAYALSRENHFDVTWRECMAVYDAASHTRRAHPLVVDFNDNEITQILTYVDNFDYSFRDVAAIFQRQGRSEVKAGNVQYAYQYYGDGGSRRQRHQEYHGHQGHRGYNC
ncbi:hypothetical protein LTR60_004462 [Cryomyces antarcticus]|nr:hypothetical protein LTR60_004462 [Cryomyces antarcticus]